MPQITSLLAYSNHGYDFKQKKIVHTKGKTEKNVFIKEKRLLYVRLTRANVREKGKKEGTFGKNIRNNFTHFPFSPLCKPLFCLCVSILCHVVSIVTNTRKKKATTTNFLI